MEKLTAVSVVGLVGLILLIIIISFVSFEVRRGIKLREVKDFVFMGVVLALVLATVVVYDILYLYG